MIKVVGRPALRPAGKIIRNRSRKPARITIRGSILLRKTGTGPEANRAAWRKTKSRCGRRGPIPHGGDTLIEVRSITTLLAQRVPTLVGLVCYDGPGVNPNMVVFDKKMRSLDACRRRYLSRKSPPPESETLFEYSRSSS
jgi:hypothetical protein